MAESRELDIRLLCYVFGKYNIELLGNNSLSVRITDYCVDILYDQRNNIIGRLYDHYGMPTIYLFPNILNEYIKEKTHIVHNKYDSKYYEQHGGKYYSLNCTGNFFDKQDELLQDPGLNKFYKMTSIDYLNIQLQILWNNIKKNMTKTYMILPEICCKDIALLITKNIYLLKTT